MNSERSWSCSGGARRPFGLDPGEGRGPPGNPGAPYGAFCVAAAGPPGQGPARTGDPGGRKASLPSDFEPAGSGPARRRIDAGRPGPQFYFFAMVEAAGVEPASGSVKRKATPCSASSYFSPGRLEKRQNDGKATPDLFRCLVRRPEAPTPAFGDDRRGAAGALPGDRGYAKLGSQSESAVVRSYFFSPFYEVGEASACNLPRARPRRSRFAPTFGSLSRFQSSKIGVKY